MNENEPYSLYSSLHAPALRALRGIEKRILGPVAPPNESLPDEQSLYRRLEDHGVGFEQALAEFDQDLVPGTIAIASPRYWGLVNGTPWPEAVWMDLLISALNNNAGAHHQSPSGTIAESAVLRSITERLGLSDNGETHLVAGGSLANLEGALLMRHQRFPRWEELGPPLDLSRAIIYYNPASHFSIERALLAVGFGRCHLVAAPIRGRGSIDVPALSQRIEHDLNEGKNPIGLFATFGTTGTGAMDDLPSLSELCQFHSLWFHVDACYGGPALLLERYRPIHKTIGQVDSIAFDPHKWFYMPVACGVFHTRHAQLSLDYFRPRDRSYIPGNTAHGFMKSIHTSRRSQGLSLWTTLRAVGWNKLREAIRRDIHHARYLETMLRDRGYEVLDHGELSIVCARAPFPSSQTANPNSIPEKAPTKQSHSTPSQRETHPESEQSNYDINVDLDHFQVELSDRICQEGHAWFATTQHAGKTWLRFNFVNLHTRVRDLHAIVDIMESIRHRLATGKRSSLVTIAS